MKPPARIALAAMAATFVASTLAAIGLGLDAAEVRDGAVILTIALLAALAALYTFVKRNARDIEGMAHAHGRLAALKRILFGAGAGGRE